MYDFALDKIIANVQKLSNDDLKDNDVVLETLASGKEKYQINDNDFDYYIALCGLFPPNRNILKKWEVNEKVFLSFVKKQGKIGIEHFMQALVLYFIRKYNADMSKYA